MNIYDTMQLGKLITSIQKYLEEEYSDYNLDVVFTDDGKTLIVHIPGCEDIKFE